MDKSNASFTLAKLTNRIRHQSGGQLQPESATRSTGIRTTHGVSADEEISSNAAQIWNHDFYCQSLTSPDGSGALTDATAAVINRDFGDFGGLRAKLAEAVTSQFESGWVWLVVGEGKLAVAESANVHSLLLGAATPILTVDVWEHAYCVGYRNRRAEYVTAAIGNSLNWKFATEGLANFLMLRSIRH